MFSTIYNSAGTGLRFNDLPLPSLGLRVDGGDALAGEIDATLALELGVSSRPASVGTGGKGRNETEVCCVDALGDREAIEASFEPRWKGFFSVSPLALAGRVCGWAWPEFELPSASSVCC